jgi:hypothetical protein
LCATTSAKKHLFAEVEAGDMPRAARQHGAARGTIGQCGRPTTTARASSRVVIVSDSVWDDAVNSVTQSRRMATQRTQLTAAEVRILGSLFEKETTTPDNYPLSLNALVAACNQSSNRDPVVSLSEDEVRWAVNNLRQQSLVRAEQHSGSRVMKYRHLLAERLSLDSISLGVLCVLMLRGPQTAGEVRGRTGRLAELATVPDAEAMLQQLRGHALVVELPRRPGQKEARWAHLLAGEPAAEPAELEARAPVSEQTAGTSDRIATLERDLAALRVEVAGLRADLHGLLRQLQ